MSVLLARVCSTNEKHVRVEPAQSLHSLAALGDHPRIDHEYTNIELIKLASQSQAYFSLGLLPHQMV